MNAHDDDLSNSLVQEKKVRTNSILLLFSLLLEASALVFTSISTRRSPAKLFARKNGMYSEVADVLVTSDCLSQDIDAKLVSKTQFSC